MSDLINKVEEAIGFNIDHDAFEGENPTRRFYQYSAKAAIKTVLREVLDWYPVNPETSRFCNNVREFAKNNGIEL